MRNSFLIAIYFLFSLTFTSLYVGPYQVLQLRVRVDLRAMAMKGYSALPKALALLESHHQIF